VNPQVIAHSRGRAADNLKDGVAPRIETVVNDPKDLRCNRMLPNLPELQAKACRSTPACWKLREPARARHL